MEPTAAAPVALLPPPGAIGREAASTGQSFGRQPPRREDSVDAARSDQTGGTQTSRAHATRSATDASPVRPRAQPSSEDRPGGSLPLAQEATDRQGLHIEPWTTGIAAYQRAASLQSADPTARALDLSV